MSFIEKYFPMYADSDNFLELDFTFIKKILSCGGLNIDSELQVFDAADSWLCHDKTERSKYAKDLLSKVRLPLLSISALKQVLQRVSSKYHEWGNTIEAVLVKKQQLLPFSRNFTSRYCNDNNFNILVCGGHNNKISNGAKLFNTNNFSEVSNLSNMIEARCDFKAVCIKGEVYVFGDNYNHNVVRSIEKYSPDTNTWEYVGDIIDARSYFSTCSLMDNIYIMGGLIKDCFGWHKTATCFKFNTKSLKWQEISRMIHLRTSSGCSVFEGRIVVTGGSTRGMPLKTVEAYDHVGNTWSRMPNMVKERYGHKSVAVKNKLFVIGGLCTNNCEVFDLTTNEFTLLKQPSSIFLHGPIEVITIGSKIFVFRKCSLSKGSLKVYDFETNEWSMKTCGATKDKALFSCVKIPVMKNDKKTQLKRKRYIFFLLFALTFLTCIVLLFYR